jgi:hypothetical protein
MEKLIIDLLEKNFIFKNDDFKKEKTVKDICNVASKELNIGITLRNANNKIIQKAIDGCECNIVIELTNKTSIKLIHSDKMKNLKYFTYSLKNKPLAYNNDGYLYVPHLNTILTEFEFSDYFVHDIKSNYLQEHNDRVKHFEEIKQVLKKINIHCDMNLCRLDCKNVIKTFLYDVFGIFHDFEVVDDEEGEIVNNATTSSILYYPKGYKFSDSKQYDVNSMFSELSKKWRLPCKKYTKYSDRTYNEDDLAIYDITIRGKTDDRLFRKNKLYTSDDLKILNKSKVAYDIKTSFVYDKFVDCSKLKKLHQIIDNLYEITKHNPYAKTIIQQFYGIMSKGQTLWKKLSNLEPSDNIVDTDTERDLAKIHVDGTPFKFVLARIKPFSFGSSRLHMSKITRKVIKKGYDVAKIKVDAIITNAPEKYFKIDKQIGNWKIVKEYVGNWEQVNINVCIKL